MRLGIAVLLLIVALSATCLAAMWPSGAYNGRTSQGLAIVLVAKGHVLKRIHVRTKTNCASAYPIDYGGKGAHIGRDGRFSIKETAPNLVFTASGRFVGRRVSGRLHDRETHPSGPTCDTGTVHFRAGH